MNIEQLKRAVEHRAYPPPERNWFFYQEWNDLLFTHWAVAPEMVANYLPSGLEPDTFDGMAYVSLVPFRMDRVRPRGLPAFPPLSNFYEFNYRTYVRRGDQTAVYFLSLEADKRLPVRLARLFSGLPYSYAHIERTATGWKRTNTAGDLYECDFEIGDSISQKTELDRWLTERYALFADMKDGSIIRLEVHHPEWPLREVSIGRMEIRSARFGELAVGMPSLAHYSPGVPVLTWN